MHLDARLRNGMTHAARDAAEAEEVGFDGAWTAENEADAFLPLGLAVTGLAQSVRWDPPGGQLGFNQVSEVSLTFTDCEPELDKLRLPAVDGLVFGQPSQSTSMSIVNFS